jgi:hypothetical protein
MQSLNNKIAFESEQRGAGWMTSASEVEGEMNLAQLSVNVVRTGKRMT